MNYCENETCIEYAMHQSVFCEMHSECFSIINFDDTHAAWMRNKRKVKGGSYRYTCGAKKKNGQYCNKKPMPDRLHCRGH